VPRALELFRLSRPGVQMVVTTADSANICKAVASGVSDVGLSAAVAFPQEVDSELIDAQSAVCIVPPIIDFPASGARRRLTWAASASYRSQPSTLEPPGTRVAGRRDSPFKPETRSDAT